MKTTTTANGITITSESVGRDLTARFIALVHYYSVAELAYRAAANTLQGRAFAARQFIAALRDRVGDARANEAFMDEIDAQIEERLEVY